MERRWRRRRRGDVGLRETWRRRRRVGKYNKYEMRERIEEKR